MSCSGEALCCRVEISPQICTNYTNCRAWFVHRFLGFMGLQGVSGVFVYPQIFRIIRILGRELGVHLSTDF